MTLRVAIVNDLSMCREALRRVLANVPQTEIAWTAADGAEAIAKAAADRPDVILMDLIMPGTDGVDATRTIMRDSPCAIIVVTATVEGNASRVYEAISAGALDAVETPRLVGDCSLRTNALVDKLVAVRRMCEGGAAVARPAAAPAPNGAAKPASQLACAADSIASIHGDATETPIVAVGSSTGGPQALATFLSSLPSPAPFAVLIVQHMEASFLPGLASWLTAQTKRTVRLARSGERPEPSAVLVAGEPRHLVVTLRGTRFATWNRPPSRSTAHRWTCSLTAWPVHACSRARRCC